MAAAESCRALGKETRGVQQGRAMVSSEAFGREQGRNDLQNYKQGHQPGTTAHKAEAE